MSLEICLIIQCDLTNVHMHWLHLQDYTIVSVMTLSMIHITLIDNLFDW